jgi:hypothetical protein
MTALRSCNLDQSPKRGRDRDDSKARANEVDGANEDAPRRPPSLKRLFQPLPVLVVRAKIGEKARFTLPKSVSTPRMVDGIAWRLTRTGMGSTPPGRR